MEKSRGATMTSTPKAERGTTRWRRRRRRGTGLPSWESHGEELKCSKGCFPDTVSLGILLKLLKNESAY